MGRYSKLDALPRGVQELLDRAEADELPDRSDSPRKPVRNVRRRLGPDTIEQLVSDYVDKRVPTPELMSRYGIGKSAVLKLLEDRGVLMRRRGLSADQVDEAIRFYEQGLSADEVGQQLGCHADTVRKRLREHGVQMRDPRLGVKRPRRR